MFNIPNSEFNMSMEYRPRTELRNGYRELPTQDSNASLLISHRGRINLDYKNDKFLFHTTLQDIRIWGDTDTRESDGKAQFYEFYVEAKIKADLAIRVGRQRIKHGNERLFAENNWRQAGGQHDVARLMYRHHNLNVDIIGGYNQNRALNFENTFDIDWDTYRAFTANFIDYKVSNDFDISITNIADEYTDPSTGDNKGYWKFTNGGRLTYSNKQFTYSLASYYQWGKIENGKRHNAYYIEPEFLWLVNSKYNFKLGAQFFSGDDNNLDNKSTSFLAQYGAFHKHNGGMDYTQSTVRTNEHEGIVNPYLKQQFTINSKYNISWQSHLLGSQKKSIEFYAWENDLSLFYKPNDYTKVEFAYLFLIANNNISDLEVGRNGNPNKIAQFSYISISWTPNLLNIK